MELLARRRLLATLVAKRDRIRGEGLWNRHVLPVVFRRQVHRQNVPIPQPFAPSLGFLCGSDVARSGLRRASTAAESAFES